MMSGSFDTPIKAVGVWLAPSALYAFRISGDTYHSSLIVPQR